MDPDGARGDPPHPGLCRRRLPVIVRIMSRSDPSIARNILTALMLSFCLVLFPPPASAQEQKADAPAEAETAEDQEVFQAPVTVDGQELFLLRGSSALPATERAGEVARRIIDVAGAGSGSTISTEIRPTEIGPGIYVGNVLLTVVTKADAELEQMDVKVLAELQANAIEQAIAGYRSERTEEARTRGALEVAGWTGIFAVFSFLVLATRNWLRRRINRSVTRRFAALDSATNEQVQARAIAALIRYGVNAVLLVLFFLGFYYYLSLVLLSFAETRHIAQLLLDYVTGPVLNVAFGIVSYLPDLITLLIIALLTRYFIKGLRVFFDTLETGTFELKNFEKTWINPTYNIARAVAIMIALVFAFPYIPGSDSAAFQGLTILMGAMLSLGANSVVGNILSGLFVIYRRSTSVGDRICIGDHVGDVVEIKLMETHLKSIKNELISIPNAQLLNSEVINYTKKTDGRGLFLHTTVGIGYEEPPEKVEAMLIEAARRTKGLKNRPEPFVLWTALGDFAISYQINGCTTRGAEIPQIKSDLHRNIMTVFTENGVQIMTPSYMADPSEPKVPTAGWDGTLAHEGA